MKKTLSIIAIITCLSFACVSTKKNTKNNGGILDNIILTNNSKGVTTPQYFSGADNIRLTNDTIK